jgi:hypothetical protein
VVAWLARFVVAQSWHASCKPVRQQVDELETRVLLTCAHAHAKRRKEQPDD